jgi:hypothetical protein
MMEMSMDALQTYALNFLEFSALVISLLFLLAVVAVIYMYFVDVNQTSQTIRRNYPVIGRFRYLFEHLGEFFRQYLFAQDREELPFNRAQRSWVYRAAKDIDSTVAFGSTHPLDRPGEFIFLNGLTPPLEEEVGPRSAITFGTGYARQPYSTDAFFNISAMSFGALSLGAGQAGISGTTIPALSGRRDQPPVQTGGLIS